MFTALLVHEVRVFATAKTGVKDRYGNEETDQVDESVYMGRMDPGVSTEETLNRDTRINRYTLFLEPDAVINALSVVLWEGRRFSVDGEPRTLWDVDEPHHIEASLVEVVGG